MRERREEKRRGKKPKQSTNIANNDFIFIIYLFLWRDFPTWPKIFPENEKKKTHENFVIFRDLFPPFFEMKIIKFSTSRLLLVAGFLYIYNPHPPHPHFRDGAEMAERQFTQIWDTNKV
jgi:hypothetical protein